jgi:hypothetical protein
MQHQTLKKIFEMGKSMQSFKKEETTSQTETVEGLPVRFVQDRPL